LFLVHLTSSTYPWYKRFESPNSPPQISMLRKAPNTINSPTWTNITKTEFKSSHCCATTHPLSTKPRCLWKLHLSMNVHKCDLCQKNRDYVSKMKNLFYCINKQNTSQASIWYQDH
jgi:hypothetical protein